MCSSESLTDSTGIDFFFNFVYKLKTSAASVASSLLMLISYSPLVSQYLCDRPKFDS